MVFELDITLNPAVAALAWLVGRWEGAGVLGYPTIESANFGQELEITHDGRPFLEMSSYTWLLDDAGEKVRPLAREVGFWRVLENNEVELMLAHPFGVVGMYVGRKDPDRPAIQLATDGVLRSPAAKEYNSGARMYGLVDSKLMWVMDMAAVGQPMQSHLSAQLKRVG